MIDGLNLISFDGKTENWRMWSAKFLAQAGRKGTKDALLGRITIPDHDDIDADDDKELLEARKKNQETYEDLIFCMTERISFGKVDEAKTKKLPDGDAAMAWTYLCNKYKPKTIATRAELKLNFANSHLESAATDPDEWLDTLDEMRADLMSNGSFMEEEDLKLHILNNLRLNTKRWLNASSANTVQ